MDVLSPIQIATKITVLCASCNKPLVMEFNRSGAKDFQQMYFLDSQFLMEYVSVVHDWRLERSGRAWCQHHKPKT